MSNDDDNDVHHESANRVGKGTLDRHQETICSLFRGSLIDGIGVFDRNLLVMVISSLKACVHTLACRRHRAGCRSPHTVWDVDVEDRDQDARGDGESDRQATEDLEVVTRDSLQPVHRDTDDSV